MKTDRKYIIGIVALFALLVAVEYYSPKPVNWEPTFSKKDKVPYGSYIVFDCLSDIFPGKDVKEAKRGLYNTLSDNDTYGNYIIVTNAFYPDTLDLDYLFRYVKNGHSVFIASDYFDETFADSLKFRCASDYNLDLLGKDSTSINFEATALHSEKNFQYKKGTVDNYFHNYDTTRTTVLGKNSQGKANFLAMKYGQGTFYLSSVPYAFTNYNALKGNNSEYIFRALSHLPVADTYWDEYYKPIERRTSSSPLGFVLNNYSLKYAYYLLLFAVILYVFFEGKRKQRIIPVLKPMQNTSLEFVETIGQLYYQKGTRIGIAQKKIIFFLDHIRSKYNLTTHYFSDPFYHALSSKTLVPEAELKTLFNCISKVQMEQSIDEASLMNLNNYIETFYRKTQ